jgi:L-asparaginase II
MSPFYQPLFELTRGQVVESIHFGAIAAVDSTGRLVASYGDPQALTFLRSSAKPFQALPFIEQGGQVAYQLATNEVALVCASHSGTQDHLRVLESLQAKTGVAESDLRCGTHPPMDEAAAEMLRRRGEAPTPNRHNCSGKHTGMLAFARMRSQPTGTYLELDHPVQRSILQAFAAMCGLPVEQVALGTDGCSAPNFAVSLYHAALAFARLCGPAQAKLDSPQRVDACQAITAAMTAYPDMVAGPGRFDTRLMQTGQGAIVAKAGAEGYQAIGLLPGALGPGSPALGIAMKISDGDPKSRARPAAALEALRQLGALSEADLQALADFGPVSPVTNWRQIHVGEARPCFRLQFNS